MTWLTASSVLLIGGALVAAQAAPASQACAPMLPGPLPSNRVLYWDAEGVQSSLSGLIGDSQVIVVGRLDSVVCRVDTPYVGDRVLVFLSRTPSNATPSKQLDGKKTADVLAEVARIIGR